MDSDLLLIQKMKLGSDTAVESFVRKYYSEILRYCSFRISDRGYAEDLTQETFEKFFRSLNRYRHYGKAANYLYVIAGNLCSDHVRKVRELPVEDFSRFTSHANVSAAVCADNSAAYSFCTDSAFSGAADPDSPEGVDFSIAVENALNRLNPEIRETAILYFCQGLKQKEIARIQNISLSLVKYRIKKSREKLQQELKE